MYLLSHVMHYQISPSLMMWYFLLSMFYIDDNAFSHLLAWLLTDIPLFLFLSYKYTLLSVCCVCINEGNIAIFIAFSLIFYDFSSIFPLLFDMLRASFLIETFVDTFYMIP